MNRIEEFDALRKEDWSGVYRDVPQSVNEGVQLAFARIHAREKRRRQAFRLVSVAACLCVALGMGAVALRSGPADAPDRVAAPVADVRILARDETVYASRADACFHVKPDCSAAQGEIVELQMVTALEFEKGLCPSCGAGVALP